MTAIMTLAGGALAFLAVITPIINKKLEKARTNTAKEKIIDTIFSRLYIGLPCIGFVSFVFNFHIVSLWFYVSGGVVFSVHFLRRKTPPLRIEIFTLAVWCFYAIFGFLNLATDRIDAACSGVVSSYAPLKASITDVEKNQEYIHNGLSQIYTFLSTNNIYFKKATNSNNSSQN